LKPVSPLNPLTRPSHPPWMTTEEIKQPTRKH
jgi:hypothetical protein